MSDEAQARGLIIRATVQKLKSLQGAGVTHLPKRFMRPLVPTAARAKPPGAAGRAVDSLPVVPPLKATVVAAELTKSLQASAKMPIVPAELPAEVETGSRPEALAAIARRVAACTRCPVLVQNRTQTVFGVGDPNARLVFIGEAPGADEDRQGIPFVGRAGQKLTDIIVKGMKLRREDVYIMNILRCRPPDNRPPLPAEAAACREYLDAQLAIVKPEFVCCLGTSAAQYLLASEVTIGKLRGRMIDFKGMKVLCTYHPSYLLRNPPASRDVWEDIKVLMDAMGLPHD